MPVTPRERLAGVLDGSQAPGAFSAQLSVPARDVRLTVAGAGPVSLPVRAPQAKRMIACARPARSGRGERTLMDLSVRDTWEITPDRGGGPRCRSHVHHHLRADPELVDRGAWRGVDLGVCAG